jgi:hypothetical protein
MDDLIWSLLWPNALMIAQLTGLVLAWLIFMLMCLAYNITHGDEVLVLLQYRYLYLLGQWHEYIQMREAS